MKPQDLFDAKGIVQLLVFVAIIFFAILFIKKLQQTPLGGNEYSNKILEDGKSALTLLGAGYFIVDNILGILGFLGLVAIFVWYWKQNERGY